MTGQAVPYHMTLGPVDSFLKWKPRRESLVPLREAKRLHLVEYDKRFLYGVTL